MKWKSKIKINLEIIIKKIELMPEDFERTPKKSIKRYLYQRT